MSNHIKNRAPRRAAFILVPFLALVPVAGAAEPELVSTMGLAVAVGSFGGMSIAPASDIVLPIYTEDLAPPQALEVIRSASGPLTVGRLMASCSCLRVTMAKKTYAQGERAIIEVRNVKPTVKGGAKYALFVQITSPTQATLQYDTFVQTGGGPVPVATPPPGPEIIRPKP